MVPENKADGLKRLGSFPGCDNSKIDPFERGLEAVPKKRTPARNPWTKEDLRQLKIHSKTRTPVVEVAKAMKRTEAAVRQKAKTIGVGLGHRR
jgi:hypothetical protein